MSKALAIDMARAYLGELLGDKAPPLDIDSFARGVIEETDTVLDDDIFQNCPATCALRLVSQTLSVFIRAHGDERPHKETLILEKSQEEFHELFWNMLWANPNSRKFTSLGLRNRDDKTILVGFTKAKFPPEALMEALKSIESQLANATPEERKRLVKETLAKVMPGISMTILGMDFLKEPLT